jgi:hypothetical protein
VHYVLKSQPAKPVHLVEVQVRTLFEEGWSEVDHQVRYPRLNDNPHLAEFLTIFNRLAGSADEMGTFIKALSHHLTDQTIKLEQAQAGLARKEMELKQAIADLKISKSEKRKLEGQVEELRQSSLPRTPLAFFPDTSPELSAFRLPVNPIIDVGSTAWSPGIVLGGLKERTCVACGKQFQDSSVFLVNDKCQQCRSTMQFG